MSNIIRIDLNGVNCYLAKSESGFILFDTGGHLIMDKQFTNRCDDLQKELGKAGCSETNLNLVVLTHGDNDHACNAAYIRKRYNTKIAMHGGDQELVENPSLDKWMESFRYHSLGYRIVFRLLKNTITKVTKKTIDDFSPFTPDIILYDGYDLSEFGLEAEVIHMPGHTKGSIAILTKTRDLIAGDTFSNNKKPSIAANADDFEQLSKSVKKIKQYNIKTVYPGHGTPFEYKKLI